MINFLKEKGIFRWIFWLPGWLLGYILIHVSIVFISNSRSPRKQTLVQLLEGVQNDLDMFIYSILAGFGLYLVLSILIFAIVLIVRKFKNRS